MAYIEAPAVQEGDSVINMYRGWSIKTKINEAINYF